MSIQKTEALVLRSQDLRETSLILTFYTKDFGKIKGIVRGVRGSRAQFGGGNLEIFAHDSIVFYERKTSDIFTVSQCDLLEFFNSVRSSLEKLAYATYMTELLDSVTVLGDKNSGVFDLAINCLRLLSEDVSPKHAARIFEIKILSLLGLMPALVSCAGCNGKVDNRSRFSSLNGGLLCGLCFGRDPHAHPILQGTVNFIELVRGFPFEKMSRVKVGHEVGRELERILRKFLDYHVGRRIKSLDFIREIEKE